MKCSNQSSTLPSLPLPNVETLLERYIEFLEPLDAVEGKKESLCFARGLLKSLRQSEVSESALYLRLLETISVEYKKFCNAKLCTSHMAPLWNSMYLGNRDPLPFGWNYTLHLDLPNMGETARVLGISVQALSAAIIGAASFHTRDMVDQPQFFTVNGQNNLPGSCRIDLNLCRDQFTRLFRTVRIPHVGTDGLRWCRTNKVLLLRKGHPFVMDWIRMDDKVSRDIRAEGNFFFEEVIANARLIDNMIHHTSDILPFNKSPIVMASGSRSEWAHVFELLWKDKNACSALDDITSCSFGIGLDDEVDFSFGLHGGRFPENRYPDMNVMYAVDPTGYASCNMEHSWGDGSTMTIVCSVIHHYSTSFIKHKLSTQPLSSSSSSSSSLSSSSSSSSSQLPTTRMRQVSFGPIPYTVECVILKTHQEHIQRVNAMDVTVRHIRSFGTREIKKFCRVSPDAFVHGSFHIAERRLFGDIRSTYAALLMKKYHHGRTETLRSVTKATQDLADTMESIQDVQVFSPTLAKSLQHMGKVHRDRINVCRSGLGFHRAASLLRRLHTEVLERIPIVKSKFSFDIAAAAACIEKEFFSSAAFRELSSDYLSTSNITSVGISSFSFAPTHHNGVGMGYSLFPDRITFTCSSLKSCNRPLRDQLAKGAVFAAYADVLEQSVKDLYAVSAERPVSKL